MGLPTIWRSLTVALFMSLPLSVVACEGQVAFVGWPSGQERPVRDLIAADFKSGEVVVTQADLTDAKVILDQNGQPAISFRFSRKSARKFGQFTSDHVGEAFAIIVGGELVSAPVIRSAIWGGSGMISGSFTQQEARDVAQLLNKNEC